MMAEQVTPDTFNPSHHKLKMDTQKKLDTLLEEYKSQFVKDETSIRTTPLTSMTIDMEDSEPVSQKPNLIAMKNYQWVRGNRKVACSQIHLQQQIELVSNNHCSAQG